MAISPTGIRTFISAVMIVLGLFIAGRLLMHPDRPLTMSVFLDAAFAFFFLARGTLHFWMQRRRSQG